MKKQYIFIILIFISTAALNAQNLICGKCGEPIESSEYVKAEGKHFHKEHFTCDKCGEIINDKYHHKDGNFYHVNCYNQNVAKVCDHCSKPISGKYFVTEEKVYHQNCYVDFIAKRCALCNGIINGKYTLDFWGNYYHADHTDKDPKCDYCGKFISDKLTNGGMKYSDGRTICKICYGKAVADNDKAYDILILVRDRLALKGIKIPTENLKLHLVDRSELNKRSRKHGIQSDTRGFASYEFTELDDKIVKKKFDIYILHGLPRDVFVSVAAHEMMHIWFYNFGKKNPESRMVEGSCNYASYLIINDIGASYKGLINNQLIKNPDPIYGEGFRSVKKYVDRYGIQRWLDHLKIDLQMPAGY